MSRTSLPNSRKPPILFDGGEAAPVGRPDFKPGQGRGAVLGRFDSCSPPPNGFDVGADFLWLGRNSVAGSMRCPSLSPIWIAMVVAAKRRAVGYFSDLRRPVC
jgi:hypothetical protein